MSLIRVPRRALLAGIALPTPLLTAPALAQSFPTRPLRVVVPFAAGGLTDSQMRVVCEGAARRLGQAIVVENRSGAGGILGAQALANDRAADGYLLSQMPSSVFRYPLVAARPPFNPLTDFTSITNVAATPNVIAVHPSFPARDYKTFLSEVKRNPGKYSFASSGTGGIGHLQMELFKVLSGTFITHIPYRGAGPALVDTAGGQVPMIFDNLPSALHYIKEGRLIPIVVAAPQRLAVLPNIPTFKEVGLEQVNRMAYYGLHGPKGLPADVVNKLYAAVKKTLDIPEVRKRIEDTGSLIVGNTPAEFAAQTKAEFEVYKKVVEQRNLKLDA